MTARINEFHRATGAGQIDGFSMICAHPNDWEQMRVRVVFPGWEAGMVAGDGPQTRWLKVPHADHDRLSTVPEEPRGITLGPRCMHGDPDLTVAACAVAAGCLHTVCQIRVHGARGADDSQEVVPRAPPLQRALIVDASVAGVSPHNIAVTH